MLGVPLDLADVKSVSKSTLQIEPTNRPAAFPEQQNFSPLSQLLAGHSESI